jgi:hypothetical protein
MSKSKLAENPANAQWDRFCNASYAARDESLAATSTAEAVNPALSIVPSRPTTLGDLVRLAQRVLEDDVIELMPVVFGKVQELAEGDDREAYLRHLIVLGVLVKRAIFEVCDVPKDADALI